MPDRSPPSPAPAAFALHGGDPGVPAVALVRPSCATIDKLGGSRLRLAIGAPPLVADMRATRVSRS